MKFLLFATLPLLLLTAQTPPKRQLVITIDDLPRGGDSPSQDLAELTSMTRALTKHLRGTHAIGFVNPGSAKARAIGDAGLQSILKIWRDNKLDLGNHTSTHPSLHRVPLADYIQNLEAAEPPITQARGGRRSVFFRHTFLHTGLTLDIRRGFEDYLAKNNYRIAPVTIDTSDYVFAYVYSRDPARVRAAYLEHIEGATAFFEKRSVEVVGREIPQIILLHANQLNADTMPDLLALFKRRGYRFIPLAEALRDPAYQLPDTYTGPNGQSWIHRWAATKGMPQVEEPAEPQWIMELYRQGRK